MSRRFAKQKRERGFRRFILRVVLVLVFVPVVLTLVYRYLPPPVTPLMLIRVFEGEGIRKRWVPLARISPEAVKAVISLEDTSFCHHAGFDWGEMADAVSDGLDGGRLRGASTISMQTAKNLFLWPGHSFIRKAIEAPLTLLLEALWDKRRIIEVYLNVIEWGPGIYGIEAASRAYFGKSAARLNRREAALLAAVLPNPRRWSPERPTDYIEGRVQTARARAPNVAVGCTRPGGGPQ